LKVIKLKPKEISYFNPKANNPIGIKIASKGKILRFTNVLRFTNRFCNYLENKKTQEEYNK